MIAVSLDQSFELIGDPEVVVVIEAGYSVAAALHRLKQHQIARNVFIDQVERQQRVTQVIQNSHEDHEVKSLSEHPDVVNG